MTLTMTADAPTVSADVRNKFNFSVNKIPLIGTVAVNGADSDDTISLKTPWFGLFRSDTNEPVGNGSVTSVYTPHNVDDVVALVDAALLAFDGEMTAKCYWRDGHYVELTPTKDYRRNIFGTKDNIFPRVLIHAGYDAKAFRASIGYYRDLCSNMHIMRSVAGTCVAIRHTSSLTDKMSELVKTFSQLKDAWPKLADVIGKLSNTTCDFMRLLDDLYGQPEADAKPIVVTHHQNRQKAIVDRLQGELASLGKPAMKSEGNPDAYMVSAWDAFNAIQGYVQHDVRRKGTPDAFARILATNNDPIVQRAESLLMALV